MDKIKISAVSYLNTKPFIYGISHHKVHENITLSLDNPADCAAKLLNGTVDMGLVPVAVIPSMPEYHIVTDYCIGAAGPVHSVMLFSKVSMQQIKRIYLDYQSRTSVMLARVLAKNYWSISPEWLNAKVGYEELIDDTTAAVVIGDRALALKGKYEYVYDLAQEWQEFTDLPFVFAAWVANKSLPADFIAQFNAACALGIQHLDEVVKECKSQYPLEFGVETYLKHHLSYNFDVKKKQAMAAFWDFIAKL